MKNIFLMLAFMCCSIMNAQDNKSQVPQITVNGEGKIKVAPDRVVMNIGVQNTGKDSKDVKSQNDETVDKVIKFLKKKNIPAEDYKTTQVNLHRSYDYQSKKQVYFANQTIAITLKDVSKYDEIMIGLNEIGVNNIHGIEFKSSKMEELQREARKKAMVNAKQKAEDYISVLGQKIGKALLISENSMVNYPQPMYKNAMAMEMMADGASNQETLAVGEIEIQATVNVTFQLLD